MYQNDKQFRTAAQRVLRYVSRGLAIPAILVAVIHAPGIAIAAANPSLLTARLNAILQVQRSTNVGLSARVIDLSDGRVLYASKAHQPLIPASNMKLLTMAAAIAQLGPDFQYKTVLAVRDMDLVVIGSGDPTLGDPRLSQDRGEAITALFHRWGQALKKAGIRQIPGNIIVDDLIFDLHFTHPHWPKDQFQKWYEAPIGGLNFFNNCVQTIVTPTQSKLPARVQLLPANGLVKIRNKTVTGPKNTVVVSRLPDTDTLILSGTVARKGTLQAVTVRDPGLYCGEVLRAILESEGIPIGGKVVREKVRVSLDRLPKDLHILAVHHTDLADVLARCGKNSLGMMAEALFKTLGAQDSGLGTWTSGRSAIHRFLRSAGVPAEEVTIDDGSGLSRFNRLSSAAATKVLQYMFHASDQKLGLLRQSLAIAGIDGTMKKRLRQEETRERIFAKTGTINGVRTLSGFIHSKSDRWLAFSIFYNFRGKFPRPKQRMDQACRLLVHWPGLTTSQSTR